MNSPISTIEKLKTLAPSQYVNTLADLVLQGAMTEREAVDRICECPNLMMALLRIDEAVVAGRFHALLRTVGGTQRDEDLKINRGPQTPAKDSDEGQDGKSPLRGQDAFSNVRVASQPATAADRRPEPSEPKVSAGVGRTGFADKANRRLPTPIHSAPLRNMPGHAKRGATAIAAVQPTIAKSLFDTYRLPGDDRPIGDITWKELKGLARRHGEASRLCALLDGYGQPTNIDVKIRDALKEDTLRAFIETARCGDAA